MLLFRLWHYYLVWLTTYQKLDELTHQKPKTLETTLSNVPEDKLRNYAIKFPVWIFFEELLKELVISWNHTKIPMVIYELYVALSMYALLETSRPPTICSLVPYD